MVTRFTESNVEEAVLDWVARLDCTVVLDPEIAPVESTGRWESYGDVVLLTGLREALERINPQTPAEAREEALRRVTRTETPCSPSHYIAPQLVKKDLSPRQRKILQFLSSKRWGVARANIVRAVGGPTLAVRDDLEKLRSFELVVTDGHGRGARWSLKNP